MNDESKTMNELIRGARGTTVPLDEPPADEPNRTGDANAGVRPLPDEPPDMNVELRRAATRARHGYDPAPLKPLT